MPAHQIDVFDAITRERVYQDSKWGPPHKHPHGLAGWLAIMQNELAEASAELSLHNDPENAQREILQVIAVGVAALEQHGLLERMR